MAAGREGVVGEGVGGGYGLASGLDLDGLAAAGGLDEFPIDQPVWASIQRPTARGGEDDGEVSLDGVVLAVVDGPGLQV